MDMTQFVTGNYLGKDDIDVTGQDITITEIKIEQVKDEPRPVLISLTSGLKPWILNKTNINILSALFGTESTAWHGKTINIYNDPTITFGGQVTGGLRVRMSPYTQVAGTPTAILKEPEPTVEELERRLKEMRDAVHPAQAGEMPPTRYVPGTDEPDVPF